MQVLIISQYYPPEGPAAFYSASLARKLVDRGHSVRVITGYPNYPTGRLYPGYAMKWRSEEIDQGVHVKRVPLYLDHSQSALRRIANYVSFGVSSALVWNWAKEADVIYVYATQMTPALGPWVWRKFGGAPYVLHVQDLWPDSITGSSLVKGRSFGKIVNLLLEPWLRSVYARAAAVIGIAPGMVKTLVSRGVQRNKAHLVYNWGNDVQHTSLKKGNVCDGAATEFLYAGNVGDMQDLETVVRAGARLIESGVRIRILGGGVALDRVKEVAQEVGASNVFFEDSVPMERVGAYYAQADYALVTLKDLPNFRGTIPSKFQAALAHGVPVVTTVQGDLRALVTSLEVGFVAESENVASLAEGLLTAAETPPAERDKLVTRTLEAHHSIFSTEAGVAAVEKVLDAACGNQFSQTGSGLSPDEPSRGSWAIGNDG